jgi:hypothetical protein
LMPARRASAHATFSRNASTRRCWPKRFIKALACRRKSRGFGLPTAAASLPLR